MFRVGVRTDLNDELIPLEIDTREDSPFDVVQMQLFSLFDFPPHEQTIQTSSGLCIQDDASLMRVWSQRDRLESEGEREKDEEWWVVTRSSPRDEIAEGSSMEERTSWCSTSPLLTDTQVSSNESEESLSILAALFPQFDSSIHAFALQASGGDVDLASSMLLEEGQTMQQEVVRWGCLQLGLGKGGMRESNGQVTVWMAETSKYSASERQFVQRCWIYLRQVSSYENPDAQARARELIPLDELRANADEAYANRSENSPLGPTDLFVRQLLHWFKFSFFQWVHNPPCCQCGSKGTKLIGGSAPTPEESRHMPGNVEVYQCQTCQSLTRFPRYNDAVKLLETRKGRCGEWAQAFTLICRACGIEARFVVDFTDHVWTEVWSPDQNRWIHTDPCENAFDNPLVYEGGWKKKLSYVLGFAGDHASDVTRRYTRAFDDVLGRRTDVSEEFCSNFFRSLNQRLANNLPPERLEGLLERLRSETLEFHELSVQDRALKDEEKIGRISGNE